MFGRKACRIQRIGSLQRPGSGAKPTSNPRARPAVAMAVSWTFFVSRFFISHHFTNIPNMSHRFGREMERAKRKTTRPTTRPKAPRTGMGAVKEFLENDAVMKRGLTDLIRHVPAARVDIFDLMLH